MQAIKCVVVGDGYASAILVYCNMFTCVVDDTEPRPRFGKRSF